MALGPGKYDDLATEARRRANARGVIVMVFDGDCGDGFSVQAPLDITTSLPSILRTVADQIEQDMRK